MASQQGLRLKMLTEFFFSQCTTYIWILQTISTVAMSHESGQAFVRQPPDEQTLVPLCDIHPFINVYGGSRSLT